MSISDKATALKQHIDGQPDSGEMYQYYGRFMNLLAKAINKTISAEEKGRLQTELTKFKNGPMNANAKIDVLIDALKGLQGGGRKRTQRTKRRSRTRRRRN